MSRRTLNNLIAIILPILFFLTLQFASIYSYLFLVFLSDFRFLLNGEVWNYFNEMLLPNFEWLKVILGSILMFFITKTVLNQRNKCIMLIMSLVMLVLWFNVYLHISFGNEDSELLVNFSYVLAILSIMYSSINNISRHIQYAKAKKIAWFLVVFLGLIYTTAFLKEHFILLGLSISPIHPNILTVVATILLVYEIFLNNNSVMQANLYKKRKCVNKCTNKKTLHKVYYMNRIGDESKELQSVCQRCGYKTYCSACPPMR
ncbi:hypothetical protein [Halobacillus kuroshimensis]|uniref:hypothetical protein n=1 Tax=Halobacillus kuroshimensis TaxID=302481 RepID=UPI00041B83B4|nr:hypothetical protein [Halobacillus kuroshimensis]